MVPFILWCEKEANVTSKAGHWITIDKGKKDGVEVGFTGVVKTFIEKKALIIGVFKVERVMDDRSELNIVEMGTGFKPEQAEVVEFKNTIIPPKISKPKPNQSPIAPEVPPINKPIIDVPKGQSVEWYLEQGNYNFMDKKFKEAKEYYNKILEINPNDPVAKRKVKECEDNDSYYSYMKSGESCLLRSDAYSALEYYLEAWKSMPANGNEALEKMIAAADSNKAEWERFREAKPKELDDCLSNSEKFMEKEDTGKRLTFYIIANKIFADKRKTHSDKMMELSSRFKGNWKEFIKDYQKELDVYFDYSKKALKEGNVEWAIDYLFYAYRFLPAEKEDVAKQLIAIAESQFKNWEKYKTKYQTELAQYLVDAKDFHTSGDIESALRFYLYGYKFFPLRALEISGSLLGIKKYNNEKWTKFADENLEALKRYIDQGNEFLSKKEFSSALNYYYIAYQLLPSQEKAVSDCFKKVYDEDKALWQKFEIDNFDILKPLLINQFYPFLTKIKDKAENIIKNQIGYWEATLFNGTQMIYIPEGEFSMGAEVQISGVGPVHKVFTDGVWIGKYEVSFEQFDAFCMDAKRVRPDDKEWGRGKLPVINLTWFDAVDYTKWLSQKTGLNFRLPYEAEWEKAARGSDDRMFPWGNSQPTDESMNNELDKKYNNTSPVGSYPKGASPFGVLDMAGNVKEWMMDWYSENYYTQSPNRNPQGSPAGSERSLRGGSWNNESLACRTYARESKSPKSKSKEIGFRVCLDAK